MLNQILWPVWAEQHAQYTLFLPQTRIEGIKCTTTKEKLRAYCPNIYAVPFDEVDDGEPRRATATTDELEVEDFKVKKKVWHEN